MSYFTSKDENSSRSPTGEKTIWYNALREKIAAGKVTHDQSIQVLIVS